MIGRTISHYKIVEKLGEGGMGVVYKAEDLTLERTVALKFPPAEALNETSTRTRFRREAQAAAGLNHPNICTIYEIGEWDGLRFIAMEIVEGRELKAMIRERPLPLDRALKIAIQACEGLKAAHDRGVFHRDIKPSNLMVTGKGQVKVMDFGLAKIVDGTQLTKSGTTLGTPAYMSPEQALAKPLDQRSDIWSLGVVLYEMITGQLPFKGEVAAAVAFAIVNTEPQLPTAVRSGVPTELDRVIEKALAKDPRERYQHIDSLASDLRRIQNGHRVVVRRRRRPSRRSLIRAAAGVGVASAGAAIWVLTSAPTKVSSLAVLPFANDSETDRDTQYLSDGVAEGVITQLSRSSVLRVLSWDAVSHYEGAARDARTVGDELGVEAVLKGRFRQSGDAVSIQVELIDATDGSALWRQEYSRSLSDLLRVENEISGAIAARLGLSPAQEGESANQGTQDPEAYRLCLRGRYYWDQRGEGLHQAREDFQGAVDRDPTYALAWAGLADTYLMLGGWSMMSPADAQPLAEAAARRAIGLDPSLAEPHATLGYVQTLWQWDWAQAEAEFRRSIELNPDYGTAHHWFAFYWQTVNNVSEALSEIEKARALSPLSPVINAEVVYFHSYARNYDRAEREAARVIGLDPDFPLTQRYLCRVYALAGERQELENVIEKLKSSPSSDIHVVAAAALGFVGATNRGRQLLEEVLETRGENQIPDAVLALAYANLGEHDRAFEYYNQAIDERMLVPSWLRDPLLDRISSDPRFSALFERMGLQQ